MKKVFSVLLALFLLASFAALPVSAEEPVNVFVNDVEVQFDVPPTIVNDRTMVPLRAIFEALGADVDWDEATRTVTAERGEVIINVTIESNVMFVNSKPVALDAPAMILGSRTLMPVRAISEAFGCEVVWLDELRDVLIWDLEPQPIEPDPEIDPQIFEVSTVDELIAAIGSNRVINLAPGTYNLCKAKKQDTPFVTFSEYYDQVIIHGVENMTLTGPEDSAAGAVKIVTDSIYADVIRIQMSSGVVLEHLTVGHTKPNKEYECEGAVTCFQGCEDVIVSECELFGCGAVGVQAWNTDELFIYKTDIYEWTYAGVYLEGCADAQMVFCDVHDCSFLGSGVIVGNTALFLSECTFRNIKGEEHLYDFIDYEAISSVHAHMCTYENVKCKQGLGTDDYRIWVDNEPAKG